MLWRQRLDSLSKSQSSSSELQREAIVQRPLSSLETRPVTERLMDSKADHEFKGAADPKDVATKRYGSARSVMDIPKCGVPESMWEFPKDLPGGTPVAQGAGVVNDHGIVARMEATVRKRGLAVAALTVAVAGTYLVIQAHRAVVHAPVTGQAKGSKTEAPIFKPRS